MAFPTRATPVYTKFTLSVTSFAISPYSGIVAGDRIIVAVDFRSPGTITAPAGYALIKSVAGGGAVGGSYYYEHICTGSETGSVTFSSSTGTSAVFLHTRVSGAHASQAAESATVGSSGDGVAVDPPSATASWGAEDNLFMTFGAASAGAMNFTGAPANYTGLTSDNASSGGAQCNLGSAYRNLASASDNPGVFTTSTNRFWSAMTIIIRPAGGGGSTGQIKTFNGTSFVAKPVKVWSGSSWVQKPVKVWSGSSWVMTGY